MNKTRTTVAVFIVFVGPFRLIHWVLRRCKAALACCKLKRKRKSVAVACCTMKKKKKTVQVRVLCEDQKADYALAFKHFAERDLIVQYVSSPPRTNRYILLIKVKDRIPEEMKRVAQKLYRNGERLDERALVVLMHHSECRRPYLVADEIENPHDTQSYLQVANIFYDGLDVFSCSENDQANETIMKHGILENDCPHCCFL